LFALRGADRSELIAGAGRNLPIGQTQVAAERIVAEDDVAALFGPELEPAPGPKDADTGLKSWISGRTNRATPFNRPPAKGLIPLNSNCTPTKPTPTPQRARRPFRVRAMRDRSRPMPTRTALKPESREGRRNQRLRQFGRPEKHQSRTLRQANRLRRHWNRNPVVALKQLPRDGRSGKRQKARDS
jgi:hypothetical protein